MPKMYLGDAIYLDRDDRGWVLTTENGIEATNTIVLEPDVYECLIRSVERLKQVEQERKIHERPG